ncbi:WD40-repeat-containing domain protein [Phellopilus nigrolimitatus]|nr:WD40-repeat-containing domain protein [Phellopilus nigrolimitatus]
MLAASAGRRIALIDPASLRSSSVAPSPAKQTALDVELTALAWASDNTALFVSAEGSIRRYDSSGHFEKTIHAVGGRVPVLAVKGNEALYYAKDDKAYELDCRTGIVTTAFEGPSSSVRSLSLSSDASLLAVASASGCTVHSLEDSTHVTLSGFPSSSPAEIAVCAFHPHSRTRLFVGYGHHLLIYDTNSPTAPVKSITLVSSSAVKIMGEIIAISSSPFSKTLAVVGCSSGLVCMIDLEKEKGLFKTLDVKQPLSSLSFTADGVAMLMGTETGQLLVQNLRTIDKGQNPKKLVISAEGKRIVGLAVQKKLKSASIAKSPNAIKAKGPLKQSPRTSKPLTTQDINVRPSPATRRTSASAVQPRSPAVRPVRAMSAADRASGAPARRMKSPKEMATPVPARPRRMAISPFTSSMAGSENSMNMSLQLETMPSPLAMRCRPLGKAPASIVSLGPPPPRSHLNAMTVSIDGKTSAGSKPLAKKLDRIPTATETIRSTRSAASASSKPNTVAAFQAKTSPNSIRSRTESLLSKALPSRPSSSALSSKEHDRLGLKPESRRRTCSAVSSSTTVSAGLAARRQKANPAPALSVASSPDIEDVRLNLPSPTKEMWDDGVSYTAPLKVAKKLDKRKGRARGANALRLEAGKPDEMEEWPLSAPPTTVEEGKRRVDFDIVEEKMQESVSASTSNDDDDVNEEEAASKSNMSLSPPHPKAHMSAARLSPGTALAFSPLRALGLRPSPSQTSSPLNPHALPGPATPGSIAPAKAQEFLRALLAPALVDFQQETRAEMLGLHLDMLRLGRDWKREMREAVAEAWEGEVIMLREENKRLREENERLRRGI